MRSPGCGSPETSSTFSLSRTPSIVTTALLLIAVNSSGSVGDFEFEDVGAGVFDRGGDVEPLADARVCRVASVVAVALTVDRRRFAVVVGVEHAHADGLVLADDAEARRLDQLDAAGRARPRGR